ncbi:MAG TPA: maleylpyruvate isomerase N-terminal domain-containing protein [Dehalococcoidia bacterium]|nr:maleylpyruvate isomerase N-terminal domain-containing protein [Dehalococcoidia bacterium]
MTGSAKADVEREMLHAWEALGSAVDSFSDVEMEQVGVIEGWCVKDLLGHIAFWASKAAQDLQAVAAGSPQDVEVPGSEEAVDEWNERERQARAGRSLADIREEWLESFQAAMDALAAFPAERLQENVKGRPVLERFAGDTYEHYREHFGDLSAWRRQLETTEE